MDGWLDHNLIQQHSLDRRQFIDFRESTLPGGMRIIDAHNSSGLTFSILPDRGMDIWSAHYNGIPLTWIAPGSPHPSDYGQSWLRLFNGGLLTTCGLMHVGPPENGRDLHGNFTRLRASAISSEMQGSVLRLTARIYQSALHGEQFEVTRTYTLFLGMPEIHIYDEIKNLGDVPVPFMLLYHCNVGYPIVQEGTELLVNSAVYPRAAAAKAGMDRWQFYAAAIPQFTEQVFFHHVNQVEADTAQAALLNATIGLKFKWNTRHMSYLTQWKNTRRGMYVCGVEPGNCIPEGQNAARESGRLVMLQPGEEQQFDLWITVLDGVEAVQQYRADVQRLQPDASPVPGFNPAGYEQRGS